MVVVCTERELLDGSLDEVQHVSQQLAAGVVLSKDRLAVERRQHAIPQLACSDARCHPPPRLQQRRHEGRVDGVLDDHVAFLDEVLPLGLRRPTAEDCRRRVAGW
jgi:hypothetical protein